MKRPQIMGILNVTPDSFSDGGAFNAPDHALEQARLMEEEGADILDIGAESTRPGHEAVSVEEECARLGPIFDALAGNVGIPISIDTYKAETAKFALGRGAKIINDVWGLQRDLNLSLIHISEPTRPRLISYAVFCLKSRRLVKRKCASLVRWKFRKRPLLPL